MTATKKATTRPTTRLRDLLKIKTFLHMPAVYDPIGARLVEQYGFEPPMSGDMSPAVRARSLNRC